jgi:hypothetical protein
MTTRLTKSTSAEPFILITKATTFSAPAKADVGGPFVVKLGSSTATVNLKSIGDAAAAKTTLILPNASSDYTFKTASGAVTISTKAVGTTKAVVIASLDLTTVANGYNTPSVQFTDFTAKFHYVAAIKKTATAPAVPAFIELTSLKLANDTGSNATDGVSFDGTINLVSRVGTTYSYSVDSGKTYQSVTGTSVDLLDKTYPAYSVKVIEKNAKGVIVNATSNANAIVVEKGAAAPTITLATDTGSSLTDGITSIGTVNVTGLENGATWQYSINGLDFVNGKGTSFVLSPNLTYDTGDIQVRQIDKAGNESDSGTNAIAWTVDNVANKLVDIDVNDTNIDGDFVTNLAKVTVNDLEDGAVLWYNVDGSTNFVKATGNSFIVPAGTYDAGKVQVKQIDAAGNPSAVTPMSFALNVDTTAPAAPTIAFKTDTGTAGDNITANNVIQVSALDTVTGTTWEYSVDSGKTYTAGTGSTFTVDAGNTYAKGVISVRQLDLAGNASIAATNAADWTILPSKIDITAANTTAYDASVADLQFFVAAGNYKYDISKFGTGDKIDFPTDNKPTVVNDSYTDDAVDLQYTSNGIKTTVHLTNLASGMDSKLFDMNAFNTQFGPGTITNYGIKSSAPISTVTHKAVSAAGSTSALTGDVSYDFASGKYDYSVSDFAKGDSLNFPAGVTPTIDNGSYSDKQATVQWTKDGSLVRVTLTGLNDQQDAAIFDASSFKTLFGTDSITNNGGATVAPVDGATLNVSVTGSTDASLGRATFSFASGIYDYTITGFGSGDVLDFPNDVPATIDQVSYTDNNIGVQWATGGSLIRVTLIGASSDSGVYDFVSFNKVFGAGSLV